MWQNNAFKLIGTYSFPGIDAEPTLDSQNLVSSDGIAQTLGHYIDNPEYIDVKTDSEDKVLEGIKTDGSKFIGGDLNVNGSASINGDFQVNGKVSYNGVEYSTITSPEYVYALLDSQEKVILGIKTDGKLYADIASLDETTQALISQVEEMLSQAEQDIDAKIQVLTDIFSIQDNPEWIQVTTDSEGKILEGITAEGKKKVMVPIKAHDTIENNAAIIESVDNPEFIEAKVDAQGRLIEGINKNGEKIFGVIPPQIKQYIDDNMPAGSGVQSIEYEEETGDMYATYDDESGVTDVYMEPNGDIYVESEE